MNAISYLKFQHFVHFFHVDLMFTQGIKCFNLTSKAVMFTQQV